MRCERVVPEEGEEPAALPTLQAELDPFLMPDVILDAKDGNGPSSTQNGTEGGEQNGLQKSNTLERK